MPALVDLKNWRFGRLLVESLAGRDSGGKSTWNVVCDCGTRKVIRASDMRSGRTKSCGCLQTEHTLAINARKRTHGMTRTSAYRTWTSMIGRCHSRTNQNFKGYGARGITVCARWRESFENFFADMGAPPPGMSLDRRDNDGNYEPGNCRWATVEEQSNNKRTSRFLEIDGRRMTIAQWAREVGISKDTLSGRLQRGWPPEQAFRTPAAARKALSAKEPT
jgi:hypothetical protein